MKDPGLMIICKVKDNIHRRILVFTPVDGSKTNFMERVYKHGSTVENTKVSSKAASKKVMVFTHGQRVNNMMANGKMASNTVQAYS